MKALFILFTLLAAASSASATSGTRVGNTWEQNFWLSGEYPYGFAVVGKNVQVKARSERHISSEKNLNCSLPQKAVYHYWNERPATYQTVHYIVPLTVKSEFTWIAFDINTRTDVHFLMQPGTQLDLLAFEGEGDVLFEYQGRHYRSSLDFEEFLNPIPSYSERTPSEFWVLIPCANNVEGWVLYSDLFEYDEATRTTQWQKGLINVYSIPDAFLHYPNVTDLTDEQLEAIIGKEDSKKKWWQDVKYEYPDAGYERGR